MTTLFIAWPVVAAVLIVVAAILGKFYVWGRWTGVLIDNRGRYSLTQLQLVLWTMVIIPLLAAVFWGKLLGSGDLKTALSFGIPTNLLLVLGISAGSAVLSTAVKSYKDQTAGPAPAAALPNPSVKRTNPSRRRGQVDAPFFAQVFMVEEGAYADKVIDVTKFQNFWITLILVVAYVALAIGTFKALGNVSKIVELPDFSQQMVFLLGISHAAYIAGKMPSKS